MFHYIYQIENLIDGKIYVGKHSTKDLDDDYMGSGKLITRAIAKHGIENFRKHIVKMCETSEEAFEFERQIVNEQFISDENTYNISLGGRGDFSAANCNTLERRIARQKTIRITNKNRWHGENADENRRKNGEIYRRLNKERHARGENVPPDWRGRHHTDETRRKIGETNSKLQCGTGNSQFGTSWIHHVFTKENKKVKRDELENFISVGWTRGRKMKWK